MKYIQHEKRNKNKDKVRIDCQRYLLNDKYISSKLTSKSRITWNKN